MKLIYNEHSIKSGIYKILNTHTDRIYIGQAKEFKNRWKGHQRSLLNNKHQNRFLQADFNKCREELGHDDFLEFHVLEVLEGSTKEERNKREEELIALWFDGGKQCYNLTLKAVSREGCPSRNPDETRRRMSEAGKKAINPARFRPGMIPWNKDEKGLFSEDTIEKIKKARACQVFSEETRAKMSSSQCGRICTKEMKRKIGEKNSEHMKELWQNPEYREKMTGRAGHEHSVETKEKISKSLKGKRKSPETIEKMREARKKLWQDPEYRKRVQQHRN